MTAFTIRRLHPDILAIDDGIRAWTVTVDPDRTVREIVSGKSRRPIKLTGPDGKRITAAIHDWMRECAEKLPAALDELVAAFKDTEGGSSGVLRMSPRETAWRRCEQLGANRYDYDHARRRAEKASAA